MKTKLLSTLLVSLAVVLLAATTAGARQPEPGVAAAGSGPKDYSRNAATGDYRPLYGDGVRTSSLAGTTSPPPSDPMAGGFSWSDAGMGAAAGFVLALAGAACVLVIRRRARPAHS
jgi:hypothetical protein